jgi:signal transduction histidine kinase
LKHRIGAVGDAVSAIRRGDATKEQLAFLDGRLYGGQPVEDAWRGHLEAFERALGYRLDLERDRTFRRASRAISRIAGMKDRLARGDGSVERGLSQAWEELRAFDRELAALVTHLVRTRVDRALLEQIVAEVRSEYVPSQVELDELGVEAPDEGGEVIEVEVFRVDLVLILKNIVRNAILAVDKSAPPRRVRVDVRVEMEPTGEEVVFICVRDTNDDRLSTESIYDRRVDRGLGLVTAALTRYDGAIEVEPGEGGYAKAVCVRFFRALGGDEET